ncbi:hypothetical protein HAX54_014581 [Datura stramonium]|uniref:Uncharacterized protein n=1 Tax=Datura stramonium TaxID=4076 RepID=A0ABS8TRC0_DATST|nr:hypothetical protein [Datura stramonium]
MTKGKKALPQYQNVNLELEKRRKRSTMASGCVVEDESEQAMSVLETRLALLCRFTIFLEYLCSILYFSIGDLPTVHELDRRFAT